MKKLLFTALGAAALSFASPSAAQDVPLVSGDFWNVSEITIDDGHFSEYADFLVTTYAKNQAFSKSKGWIKASYILANINKRADEPDLYLVTITDHVTTPAEDLMREKEFITFLSQTSRQQEAGSGARAKFRHLGGNFLLQELVPRR
jgi:hypothetical protein